MGCTLFDCGALTSDSETARQLSTLSRPCVSSLRPANMGIPRLNLEHGGVNRRIEAGCRKLLAFIKRYKTVADDEAMI